MQDERNTVEWLKMLGLWVVVVTVLGVACYASERFLKIDSLWVVTGAVSLVAICGIIWLCLPQRR